MEINQWLSLIKQNFNIMTKKKTKGVDPSPYKQEEIVEINESLENGNGQKIEPVEELVPNPEVVEEKVPEKKEEASKKPIPPKRRPSF